MENLKEDIYDILSETRDVNKNNQKEVLDAILTVYKVRHNALQSWFVKTLLLDNRYLIEKTVQNSGFNFKDFTDKQTPDILYLHKNDQHKTLTQNLIIDFGVSTTRNLEYDNKLNKYEKLRNNIQKYEGDCTIFPFIVNPNLTDVEFTMELFINKFKTNIDITFIDYDAIREIFDRCLYTISKLKDFISDPELLKRFFKKEFENTNDNNESLNGRESNKDKVEKLVEFYKANILSQENRNESTKEKIKEKSDNDYINFENSEFLGDWKTKINDLLNNKDIQDAFDEKETTSIKLENAINQIKKDNEDLYQKRKAKPSHHFMIPLMKDGGNDLSCKNPKFSRIKEYKDSLRIDGLRKEQQQIYTLLGTYMQYSTKSDKNEYISQVFNTMKDSLTGKFREFNINMFNEGKIFNDTREAVLREKYHADDQKKKSFHKTINQPFLQYYYNNVDEDTKKKMPKIKDDRFLKQKILRLSSEGKSEGFKTYWEKSNSGYKRKPRDIEFKEKTTINFELFNEVDIIRELLNEDVINPKKHPIEDYIFQQSGDDADILRMLKNQAIDENKDIYSKISKKKGFAYLSNYTRFAEQMMHFSQFSLPSNTISMFTSGLDNVCTIINNSYHNSGKDVGKAFMNIGYTDDPRWLSEFFGNFEYFEQDGLYFFCTNWRRIETFKVTFLRDQFYSVLSTSLGALSRYKKELTGKQTKRKNEIISHHFVLKVVISLTTNQRIAEMLADMRYAIMASFSEFSEIEKLIKDKFKPPYNTVMEAWIMSRMENLKDQVKDFVQDGNINALLKKPIYTKNKRHCDSIGGTLRLPSIWDNCIFTEIQDLLDDMFLYVHTLKEPSSIHHENIKAINTILKYQEEYDKLSIDRKKGNIKDTDSLKKFLLDDSQIGHVSEIVQASSRLICKTELDNNPDYHFETALNESPAEITSTKASIPEYSREIIETKIPLKKTLKQSRFWDKLKEVSDNQQIVERTANLVKTNISKESFLPYNNRSKVHDCLLDVLERKFDLETVFDIAEWNIKENNSRVCADICIKAQYGAKREFYVINVGAKCNARILEKFFQSMCKQLPNEMISVPGDKKILVMQDFINEQLRQKGRNEMIFFVNGDCTKWSAAETMEAFMSLVEGMRGYLSSEYIDFLKIIIDMWSNKDISIPQSILQNTFFKSTDTSYLANKQGVIRSEQNFLQGMFNYMSSYKAVCSSNFTMFIWKELYPESTLKMNHLEHSDDYSLVIKTESVDELKRFRRLHRMSMKFHGFNDSIKKTNTQQFLLEFISLVSFNGHMTYPHIKKLKEAGMNLGCTGYRDDMDSVISRVSECVRVGVNISTAYIFQRIHCYNVYRSYSLEVGQENNVHNLDNVYNMPVEIFGIPDALPLISFICKGDPNNYRLYNYSNGIFSHKKEHYNSKDIIRRLYLLQRMTDNQHKEDLINDDRNALRLFHPKYTFDIENKLIKKIRSRLNSTMEESVMFWEKHPAYNFVKPNNRQLLVRWMESMYYKSTFAMAYSRNSRSQITLRLSTFSRKKCCFTFLNDERVETGLNSWLNLLFNKVNPTEEMLEKGEGFLKEVDRVILNCDNNIYSAYNLFNNMRLTDSMDKTNYTVSSLTPLGIDWLGIDNSAPSLIQYIFNYDDMILDKRPNKGITSLESDKCKIVKALGQDFINTTDVQKMKTLFNEIQMSKGKRNMCMTFDYQNNNLEDYLSSHISKGMFWGKELKLSNIGIKETINPHTGEIVYKKLRKARREDFKMLIDDSILIYVLYRHMYKQTLEDTINLMESLSFSSKGSFRKLSFTELMKMDDKELIELSSTEMKNIGYLKYITNIDKRFLEQVLMKDMFYTYKYVTPFFRTKSVVNEVVDFNYQGVHYKALLIKGSSIIIVTNSLVKRNLSNAYIIALKLFSQIKLSAFEKMINNVSLRDTMNQNLPYNIDSIEALDIEKIKQNIPHVSKILIKTSDNSLRFDSDDNLDNLLGQTITPGKCTYMYSDDYNDEEFSTKEDVFQRINVDEATMTVTSGRQKLYTVPFLTAVQSNSTEITLKDNDVREEAFKGKCNGIDLSWWLKSDRIYKLLHGDDMPINKEVFQSITEFSLKSNKRKFLNRVLSSIDSIKNNLSEWYKGDFEDIKDLIEDWTYDRIKNNELEDLNSQDQGAPVEEEFDFSLLDDELGSDFGSVTFDFGEFQDDEFDVQMVNEIVKQQSESSKSSNNSQEVFMTKEDLNKLVPIVHEIEQFSFNTSSLAMGILESRGDPTQYVINNFYVDQSMVMTLSGRELYGLIVRFKDMLANIKELKFLEVFYIINITESIINCIRRKGQIVIQDDFVLKIDDSKSVGVYMAYSGVLDDESGKVCISKGGFNSEDTWYIPLSESRLTPIREQCMTEVTVDKFCEIGVLEECYFNLFKKPFKRIGMVNLLLSELM